MQSAVASSEGRVPSVLAFTSLLDELLTGAAGAKPTPTIEPALQKSDFGDIDRRIAAIFPTNDAEDKPSATAAKLRQYAVIETAIRNLFSNLIASTAIDTPEFVRVWNLFDLISILSDEEKCDPALLFWLVEELLDCQTIAGCRIVFDYLESRRERITAKHFKQKHLVILRSCNELLRRLSRAEDTAFCGRVFIFMFQSFPLGDRSSVNLRGEYHVENVTDYDQTTSAAPQDSEEKMDVDKDTKSQSKVVSFDSKGSSEGGPLNPDSLYPIFWSLQESFSQPKLLFEGEKLASFKLGLEATLKTFQAIQQDQGSRTFKSADGPDGSLKRKRDDDEDGSLASNFNPKYLTSRDLFDLEISDLSFRRHILGQAFIIIEFLLSLSAKAKEKHGSLKASNKSVLYMDYVLSEDDAKWASDMKKSVEDCLKQGNDGPQFHRMIETVLARDKNWARWKAESCFPIELAPVSADTFDSAQAQLRKLTRKHPRRIPLGSVPLDFLKDEGEEREMDKFKAPDRYQMPELEEFRKKIADDDFEIEMPDDEESKAAAIEAKASKTWRALRIAAKTKLSLFDKVSESDNIDAIFGELEDPDAELPAETEAASPDNTPSDQRPIVIVGPLSVGKSVITDLLAQRRPGAFGLVARHTTREAEPGEAEARRLQFVDKQAFAMLRDGDVLLEYVTVGEADYGTSRRTVEAVSGSGKVPVVHLDDLESAQQLRDNGFQARFVLLSPPKSELLEARLKQAGKTDETAQAAVAAAARFLAEGDDVAIREGFDLVLMNDDLEATVEGLDKFVYGNTEGQAGEGERRTEKTSGSDEAVEAAEPKLSEDATMADATTANLDARTDDVDEEEQKVKPSAGK